MTVQLISYDGAEVDPAPQNEHLGYRNDRARNGGHAARRGAPELEGRRYRLGAAVHENYARAEMCDPNGINIGLRQWFR